MSSNKLDEIVNDAYKKFFNPSKKNFKTKSVLINEVLNDNNLSLSPLMIALATIISEYK